MHSQSITELRNILVKFEYLLNLARELKLSFLVILGDFNARSKSWWCEAITSHKGLEIESLTMSRLGSAPSKKIKSLDYEFLQNEIENISSIKSKRKYDCYNKEQLLQ